MIHLCLLSVITFHAIFVFSLKKSCYKKWSGYCPIFELKFYFANIDKASTFVQSFLCPGGEIGRHATLRW